MTIMLQAQTATIPTGSGTSSDPYQISSLENLYWVSQNTSIWSSYFAQTADIDASATASWTHGFFPIGNIVLVAENTYDLIPFTGTYNGRGHNITGFYSGFYSSEFSNDYVGFFGALSGATVDSLNLLNIHIIGSSYMGGLAGEALNGNMVRNCVVTGTIENNGNKIGGLIGYNWNNSIIQDCHTNVTISNFYDYGAQMGLLVGQNDYLSSINNCYAEGSVRGDGVIGGLVGENSNSNINNCYAVANVTGYRFGVGGLVGRNSGSIINSYCSGTVSKKTKTPSSNYDLSSWTNYTGGFVGENNSGAVSRCHASSTVNSIDTLGYVGGFAGLNFSATIDTCYTNSNLTLSGMISYVGGFIGYNNNSAEIGNCYATGTVSVEAKDSYAGSFAGVIDSTLSVISNCYAVGQINSTDAYAGGFVGLNGDSVKNCFWDTQTTGLTNGYASNIKFFDATGKTTLEMKTQSTFTNAGWDFSNVWAISSTENDGYPYLAVSKTRTGLYDTKYNTNITIYPNPASDVIHVIGIDGTATMSLWNLEGKMLFTKEVTTGETVSVNTLPNGIYLTIIKSKNIMVTKKLIIQQ